MTAPDRTGRCRLTSRAVPLDPAFSGFTLAVHFAPDASAPLKHVESLVMTQTDLIEVNAKIMLGKPVSRGTRIPVEVIVRKIGEGATERDLLDGYPGLTPEAIRAALVYAAETLAHEATILIDPPAKPSRG